MTRFEPATSGSTDRRSNQLSYIHHKFSIVIILIFGRCCQKNFPQRFCKPGRTNKQPLIKSAAAGHKNPAGARNSKRSRTPQTHQFHRARVPQGHANPAGSLFFTRESNPSSTQTLPGASVPLGEPIQASTQFQALTHPPPGTPQTHQFHRVRFPQGRAMQTRPRRALPNYLAGAAVCGAGKWRRLWRT